MGVHVGHGFQTSPLLSKELFEGPSWRNFDDLSSRIARQAKRVANGDDEQDVDEEEEGDE